MAAVRRLAPLLLVAVLFPGCADPRVNLGYRLEEGTRLRYSLRLLADVERTLEDETRRERIEAVFRASQEVLEAFEGGGGRVGVTLDPISLTVNGRTQGAGSTQDFVVLLGPDGEVEDVEEPAEGGPEPLAPVGIERLLPRLRPVLPEGPVGPGDAWTSGGVLSDEDGSFSLEARSRLAALGEVLGRRAALVRTTYTSPVDRREVFANAVADLRGLDVGTQEAWFSLEGFLVRAEGDSVGRYAVTFLPPGDDAGVEPVEGRLRVRLRTEMRLIV